MASVLSKKLREESQLTGADIWVSQTQVLSGLDYKLLTRLAGDHATTV